jgi:hypothetical protein
MSLEWHSAVVHPRTATPPLRCASRTITPVQFQPFLQFLRSNYSRINTSKNISSFRISFIGNHLKSTGINTSGNKDLKSPRINTSGSKDLKSRRISTSKKHGRGVWKSACRVRALLEVRRTSLVRSQERRDLARVDHNRTGREAFYGNASSRTTKSRRIDSY